MCINPKILEYVNSLIPSIERQIEATRRYEICLQCDKFDLRENIEICKLCGCRLTNKAFDLEPQCPLKKH